VKLLGVLLVPLNPAIAEDLARWGITSTVNLAQVADVEPVLTRRVKGASMVIFASFARRWAIVTEAIRTCAQHAGGDVSLRFYQPDCTIDVRYLVRRCEPEGYCLCPCVREYTRGEGAKASQMRRAVKDAIADLDMPQLARKVA
jgi:hypothetical protein